MSELTDEQCDEFRRLPGSFNDMVRAIYQAGMGARQESDAVIARNMVIGDGEQISKTYDHACRHVMNAILDNKGD